MPESGHFTPQLPPHWLLMSLGAQHLLLTQAKCSQSSPVVQPCASLQRFEQFPLQPGPQQRSPEHAPLSQSSLLAQRWESGHFTPQLLPHLLLKSLGVQHFPLMHAWNFPQASSLMQSCPSAAHGQVSSRRPTTATPAMTRMRLVGLLKAANRALVGLSSAIIFVRCSTTREVCGQSSVRPWVYDRKVAQKAPPFVPRCTVRRLGRLLSRRNGAAHLAFMTREGAVDAVAAVPRGGECFFQSGGQHFLSVRAKIPAQSVKDQQRRIRMRRLACKGRAQRHQVPPGVGRENVEPCHVAGSRRARVPPRQQQARGSLTERTRGNELLPRLEVLRDHIARPFGFELVRANLHPQLGNLRLRSFGHVVILP